MYVSESFLKFERVLCSEQSSIILHGGSLCIPSNRHYTHPFQQIFEEKGVSVAAHFPENSPQKLLWEEQKKRLETNPHGMRWNPPILCLCIAICAQSSATYELIRTSGFFTLPTQRNLRHYTNFTDS